ncbi:radical SAM family heme chaperone HemW [Tissierella creatinophila]|uniref:Heme chaperone HemW n=1 Tax=Tissierella creatinophila DSM 6911 TaxID=1123403 RepID=A0A1U7M809_TISCR|nr:radical SAM family heme chaperone HemW [Tissierella creatinophila]OLS03390.1 oxygen-independent coproporphyrinogen-III oxidase-like protein YqeR [Tissierella creatinophila DSM 6911]
MKEIGLYIHIPFCKSKCYYCDFTSFSNQENIVEKYIENLVKELSIYKEIIKEDRIKTIFIGGGTPSYIDEKHIEQILKFIRANFNIETLEEVTIEINPGTLDIKKAKVYKNAGINRISMGVQTLNDTHLKNIGRIHTQKEFYDSYDILRKAGFTNINVDFIFGLPDETIEDVEENLKAIESLKPEHVSYYGLILEKDTPLYRLNKNNKLNLPSESQEREMYHLIKKRLKNMGYRHYEISNFALKEKECKHNILYWTIEPYIGVGLSSHSYLNNRRFWNRDNFKDYFIDLNKGILPIEGGEDTNRDMEIAEFSIMSLRLIEGIDKKRFKERFKKDIKYYFKQIINKHLKDGLIVEDDNFIKLTSKGLDLSNLVEIDFLL